MWGPQYLKKTHWPRIREQLGTLCGLAQGFLLGPSAAPDFAGTLTASLRPLLRLRLLRQPAPSGKEAPPGFNCAGSALGPPCGRLHWGLLLLLTSNSHFWFLSVFLFLLGVCERILFLPVSAGSPPAQAHALLPSCSHTIIQKGHQTDSGRWQRESCFWVGNRSFLRKNPPL